MNSHFRTKSDEIRQRFISHFQEKIVTIYGPYHPSSALERLYNLRNELSSEGYIDTELVRDREDTDEYGRYMDSRTKSFYWLEKSDFNILLYLRTGPRNGLISELEYVLSHSHITKKSLVVVEIIEREDTERLVTELLRNAPRWKMIARLRIEANDDYTLVEKIKMFLKMRIYDEIRGIT